MFARLADDADRSLPAHRRPRRALRRACCPTCSRASRQSGCGPRSCGVTTPSRCPRIDLFHVAPVRASVADAVAELVDELPRVGRIAFRRLTSGLVERLEVIVRFLALLELFKQGWSSSTRASRFGDIEIEWLGSAVDDARSTPPWSMPGDRRLRGMTSTDSMTHRTTRGRRDACGPSRRSCWSPPSRSSRRLLAQLLEQPTAVIERAVRRAGERLRRGRPRLPAGQGRRRLPLPDPRRPGAVRRALRARRPAGPHVRAALETLAIVAYKQPISRAQIASIRGVDPDGVLRTLQARGYIDRGGRTPARARRSCGARPRCSSRSSASTRSPTCRRSPSSCPGAEVVEALEHGLRVTPEPEAPGPAGDV